MDEPNVDPARLIELLDAADRLVVRRTPNESADVLFESAEPRAIASLRRALRIERPSQRQHCMCVGSPAIFIYCRGEPIGIITNHHGLAVRFNEWNSDAPISDREAWLRWFDEHGMSEPRDEVDRMTAVRAKSIKDYERWLAAMPRGLEVAWQHAAAEWRPNIEPLNDALAAGHPNRSDQIRRLLHWYGSGAGPWSGFPAYEEIARQMLSRFRISEIAVVADTIDPAEAGFEGFARFVCSWDLWKNQTRQLRELTVTARRRLEVYAASATDGTVRRLVTERLTKSQRPSD